MESNTIAAVRDIFVMVAAGVLSAVGITAIAIVLKLYRPLRETVHNAAATSRNLRQVSGDFAAVSEETAANISQTSRNALTISENLKEGSSGLSETARTAGEAAKNVAAAANTVGTIAESVSRLSFLGGSGGGSSSGPGVGTMLRLLRTVLGGSSRRGDERGAQQGV